MDDPYSPRPVASWFIIAAIASVLFMGLGCISYLMHVFANPATMPLDQRAAYEAEPAWVIVAPPDFAPAIENAITLYDVAYDAMVQLNPTLEPADRLASCNAVAHEARPFEVAGIGRVWAREPRSGSARRACDRRRRRRR